MLPAMITQTEKECAVQQPAEWPFVVEFFIVEGTGFRCMAYRDPEGKWRNAFNHEELSGDVQLLE
jgi:hypothetical protein